MSTERSLHPLLRKREASLCAAVQAHAGHASQGAAVDGFATLRQWKNDS